MKPKYFSLIIIVLGILITIFILGKSIITNQKNTTANQYHEAAYYQKFEDGKVGCQLCPNRCVLSPGQRGLCKARENIKGTLYSLVYGKPVTVNVDPIEKKPLYHFLPGAKAYSLATAGCNLNCQYCQNWDISQRQPEDLESKSMTPEQVVDEALQSQSGIIAFTYNEPTVWYEYMLDIAKLAKERGLRTVMISNGYINKEPLVNLLPYLDAVKIDFKSFNPETYTTLTRGKIEPVMESIKTVYQSGKWLELVYLVVPGYTDNLSEIKDLCSWVKNNTADTVPVHFLRFYPKYKLTNLPPTPEETIKKAYQVCKEAGLKYIYTGNIDDQEGSTTFCPDNHQELIKRQGFFIQENTINNKGKSPACPSTIAGVWE